MPPTSAQLDRAIIIPAVDWCRRYAAELVRLGHRQPRDALDALAMQRWDVAGDQNPEDAAFFDYRSWTAAAG